MLPARAPRSSMLQALLHNKLNRWLAKDAYSIEDLLTSVVLGSAAYADHDRALLPFIGRALDLRGEDLGRHLAGARVIQVEFWPNWGALELAADDDEEVLDGVIKEDGSPEDPRTGPSGPDRARSQGLRVPRSQPEVVIELELQGGTKALLLVEAKLHSGKSSVAISNETVNDQLAKYWLQLGEEAERRSARALAVIYLTRSSRLPKEELQATQEDLATAHKPPAPLYWLSWRTFAEVVDEATAPPILRDCISLLRDRWQLVHVKMEPWPVPPTNSPVFAFRPRFDWSPPNGHNSHWSFEENNPR